jgi:gliding motility-associated lipoprotein GldH
LINLNLKIPKKGILGTEINPETKNLIKIKKVKRMSRFFVFSFFLILIYSCDSKTIISMNKELPGVWKKEEIVTFNLPELDSLKGYNLFINLRNTNDYKFNNIYLIVVMNSPYGRIVTDTLEYQMAKPDGTWLGNGIGNVKENKLWYKEHIFLNEKGPYTVSISQAMRNNGAVSGVKNLEGIIDVGLSVEKISLNNL